MAHRICQNNKGPAHSQSACCPTTPRNGDFYTAFIVKGRRARVQSVSDSHRLCQIARSIQQLVSLKIMSFTGNLRAVIVVTLALFASAASAQSVTVVEFYNKVLDAYFITGRLAEQSALDGQSAFKRTGMTFEATSAASAATGSTRICRFYISLTSPATSSHFYGREGTDCQQIQTQKLPGFSYEGFDFSSTEPVAGVCPASTTSVYRSLRAAAGGKTPNHRYTTSAQTYKTAQSEGYVGEGVVFCAAIATDVLASFAVSQNCGTFYYPGNRITYQTSISNGAQTSFQRFMNPTNEYFYGESDATAVVDSLADSSRHSLMIINGLTTWTVLGTSNADGDVLSEVYYSPPAIYPRDFAVGESVAINRQLFYSGTNTFGVTQTGSVTFVGKEAVSVPFGSYGSACKFVTQIVTKTAGTGLTTTTVITNWIADRLGIVKSVTDTNNLFSSGARTQLTTTNTASFVQPL